MTTVGVQGRGSGLYVSADGTTYVQVAQLRKFAFTGKKTQFLDNTDLLTPDNQQSQLAVRVDPGEVSYDGVLNPNDDGLNLLDSLQGTLTRAWFRIVLPVITPPDATLYDFRGYVSEYVPAEVEYNKALSFSGKIRIVSAVAKTLGTPPSSQGTPAAGEDEDMGPTTVVNSNRNIAGSAQFVEAYGGASGIALTLQTPSGNQHPVIYIMKMDAAAGAVTINANINGDTSYVLVNQWQMVALGWDGAQWYAIGEK